MGRRDRGKEGSRGGSRGGPQDRVRGRVRERTQGRSGRGGGGGSQKKGPSFDLGDIQGFANRLASQGGGSGRGRSAGRGIDASALAGAASGLAGGGLASKFLGGGPQGSDEDFRAEIADQLSLMDERLHRLEEQMAQLLGETEADTADPTGPEDPADPYTNS